MVHLHLLYFIFLALLHGVCGSRQLYSRQQSLTGDKACGSTMCIQAIVNGTTTSCKFSFLRVFSIVHLFPSLPDILSSLGKQKLGWMAMGFGRQMTGTPMVIMWINKDGSVTLSQRSASDYVMPTVDPSPPRLAVKALDQSITTSSAPSLAYTISTNGDTKQPLIYAYGTTVPSSSAEDATIVQHLDMGLLQLDLSKQLTTTSAGSTPYPTGTTSDTGSSFSNPLLPYQKLIVAHAIFCTVGFLFLLPLGALLARYLRTFITTWFKYHWIVQFALAGPVIIIGIILGIGAVGQAKALHFDDNHKRWGIALLALYLVQCGLGAFIHFVKQPNRVRRPPQNYLHAVFGIAIIGLSLYQVHSGYDHEWPSTTGRDPLPSVVKIVFYIWAVFLPVSYAFGLAFLRKQYQQEQRNIRSNAGQEDRDRFNLKQIQYSTVAH